MAQVWLSSDQQHRDKNAHRKYFTITLQVQTHLGIPHFTFLKAAQSLTSEMFLEIFFFFPSLLKDPLLEQLDTEDFHSEVKSTSTMVYEKKDNNNKMPMRQSHSSLTSVLPQRLSYLVLNSILYGILASHAGREYTKLKPGICQPVIIKVSKTCGVQTDPDHQVTLHVLSKRT